MEPIFKDSAKLKVQELLLRGNQFLQTLPRGQRLILLVSIIGLVPGFFVAKLGARFFAEKYYARYISLAQPSFVDPRAVQSDPVVVLPIFSGEYAAYVKIINPNFELAASGIKYEMQFFTSTNQQIATSRGNLFLLPGQSKFVVIPKITASERIVKATINFSSVSWQKRTSIPTVKLRTSSPVVRNQTSPQALVVSGEVLNESPYHLKKISLTLLLYDRNNKIIAVSSREEYDVPARGRRAYTQLWSEVFSSNVVRVEVQAETNTLDDTNLQISEIQKTPGSSLDRP
jgi:hypothetical protein